MLRALLWKAAPLLVAGNLALAQPADVELYEIDVENSDIHWLVYKAGTLSRFGHNHVVSVAELTGSVRVHPRLEESRFEMEIPVAGLVVDDPALRALEGEAFTSKPSAEDIAGTRGNMLGEDVLNAASFPTLRISGSGPIGETGSKMLELTVEILGRSIELSVPTAVSIEGDTLAASGSFRLTHEALGMEPFSVMLGALAVAEHMDFAYRVTAHRVD